MALDSLKFESTEFAGHDVASLPDRPGDNGITAAQLKAWFDYIPKTMIALGKHNDLIDALMASADGESGADNIGATQIEGVVGTTVQAILEALAEAISTHTANAENPHGVTAAQVGLGNCDNTSDANKPVSMEQAAAIAALKAYTDSLVFRSGAVSSIFGRAGDVMAAAGDYTAEQVGAVPNTRKINDKVLSADIALNVADVGGSNRNLLDNWYFLNPVNQRGVSGTISTAGYFIDRWKLVSGSVTLSSAGLTLNGVIAQISETAWGTNVKASVKAASGTATITYDNATKTTTITSSGGVIEAAKLELGSVSTLANDPPPDDGQELAKCQRYYWNTIGTDNFSILGFWSARTTSRIYGFIYLPQNLRKIPSVTLTGTLGVQRVNGKSVKNITADISTVYITGVGNIVTVDITLTDGTTPFTVGEFYRIICANKDNLGLTPGYLEFNSNL